MSKYTLLKLNQPVGIFGLAVLPIEDIIRIHNISRRHEDTENGIQRKLQTPRVKEIANFIDTKPDKIAFPTPIILSLPDSLINDEDSSLYSIDSIETNDSIESNLFSLYINDTAKNFAFVIDGQHRLAGIQQSKAYKDGSLELELPVLFIIEASISTCAYLFSTINGNQRPVPNSLVADLFALQPERSIEKTAHNIAVDLNSSDISPFNGRIKMLGMNFKNTLQYCTLSQGTIVKEIEKLLDEKKRDAIFKDHFKNEQDGVISKIIINMFSGARSIWYDEWDNKKSIIRKTVGFHAFMKALPILYAEGSNINDLSKSFFENKFFQAKIRIEQSLKSTDGIYLTPENFPSNLTGAKKLFDFLITNDDF